MGRLALCFVLLVGLGTSALGQGAPPDARRFLSGYIDLQVVDDNGGIAASSPRLVRPVDVNGAIRVRFRRDSLSAYQPAGRVTVAAADTSARRLALLLLDDLNTYGRVADSLAKSLNNPVAFATAAQRARQWYAGYTGHLTDYFMLRAKREQPDAEPNRTAAILAQPYLGQAHMPAFLRALQSELQRLFQQAADATPDYGVLRLAALRITPKGDTIQVKVPGYDSTAERSPTTIRKVTTEMTPAESASVAFTQAASKSMTSAGDLAAYALRDYVQIANDARSATQELLDALQATADSIRAPSWRSVVLTTVPADAKAAQTKLEGDIRSAMTWLQLVVDSSGALKNDLRSALDAGQDPMSALGAISRSFGAATTVLATLRRGPGLEDTLVTDIRALVAKVPTFDPAALTVGIPVLNRMARAYGRLAGVIDAAKELLPNAQNLSHVADAFSDAEVRRLKLVPQPVTTAPESEILMIKAGGDRTEGDMLIVHADLVTSAGGHLASYDWFFDVQKLGWSSRFAPGIGFAKGLNASTDQAMRPIPVVAWMLRFRWRGESSGERFGDFLDPSIGVHTTTLSTEQQPIQVGVGLSVNLLHDFLQGGCGRKLQPVDDNDRYYCYFGLGVLKLADLGK